MPRKLISFDWAIKRLLRSKANFAILEGFLSELLFEDITILEILESESNKEESEDKLNRVDIKVKNTKHQIILIELQYGREQDYFQRMLFGVSKTIIEHIKEGESYSKVVKVISINILYFNFGEGDDYIYKGTTEFRGIHNHSLLKLNPNQAKLYNTTTLSDVYPEYYVIKVNNFDEKAKDTLDEWMLFLKTETIIENPKAKGLKEAKEKLDYLKMDESQQKHYDAYKKRMREEASTWEGTYVLGHIKGEQKGRKEGLKEGLKEGEHKAKLEIAKNLIGVLDDETIALKTGLSLVQIEGLKRE